MSRDNEFRKYRSLIESQDPQAVSLIHQLMEFSAVIKDKEINNRLLQQLVIKYSELENKLKILNQELTQKQNRLELDLSAAAEIQKSLLPKDQYFSDMMEVAWKFRPCDKIGGDIFNIIPLNGEHCAFYMIDVAGHGVQAAMIAVTVYQYLQPQVGNLASGTMATSSAQQIRRPAKVLEFLDREYPFERFNSFFTMNYVVLNTATGVMTAGSAGHPPPIILRQDGRLRTMKTGGRPIGTIDLRLSDDVPVAFLEDHEQIQPGDKLLFYTDGVTEYQNDRSEIYGKSRFHEKLLELKNRPISEFIDLFYKSLIEFGHDSGPKDDISLLGVELKKRTAAQA
jgi:sigma-B regulation protein RsbU (phosphoserine phosphatase)